MNTVVQPVALTNKPGDTSEHYEYDGMLSGRTFGIGAGILIVALLIGAWGMVVRLSHGLGATDLSSQAPWGSWVAFYIYFIGLSAGTAILSSLVYAFRIPVLQNLGPSALLLSLVCWGIGMGFIGIDLGRLDHSLNTVLFFHWTSPLSWAVRAYIVYIALVVVQLIMVLFGRNDSRASHRGPTIRILSAITLPIAILGVMGAEGAMFAVVKARGMWSGGLLPVILLVSAFASGLALAVAVNWLWAKASGVAPDAAALRWCARLLLGALVLEVLLTGYEYTIPLLSLNPHETRVIRVILTGPYAWTFWLLQIVLGLVIPLLILATRRGRQDPTLIWLACLSVLVGVIGVRFNIVVPPQIVPVIEGYPQVGYFPTGTEWLATLFLMAAGALFYLVVAQWKHVHHLAAIEENHV